MTCPPNAFATGEAVVRLEPGREPRRRLGHRARLIGGFIPSGRCPRGAAAASSRHGDKRPRVLVLGGGFGGIGAARKLKDADADVVLVDKHDYHTFQPLLYQLATGLLGTTTVGAPAARPLPRAARTSPSTRPRSPGSTSTRARCSSPRWRR